MRIIRRWAIIIVGVVIIVAGIIISPIPGPGGMPVILGGLMVLALEVAFARRVLLKLRRLYGAFNLWRRNNQMLWICLLIGIIISYIIFGILLYKHFFKWLNSSETLLRRWA